MKLRERESSSSNIDCIFRAGVNEEQWVETEMYVHTAKLEKRNRTSLVSIHYEMMEKLPHPLFPPQPFSCKTSFFQTCLPLISSYFVFTH